MYIFQFYIWTTKMWCIFIVLLKFIYFQFADLQLQLCSEAEKRTKPDPDKLVFGREFTDHMLEIEWTRADGWGVPTISPFHNLSLHPAAKVLHYATEVRILEGASLCMRG